mmetsp:Transcript_83419/g.183317  ORF Transcript_83419/g.183317 Transcript_83419/m.183317 type:complete len:433 (+) Transcript_83419:85-1383(+)
MGACRRCLACVFPCCFVGSETIDEDPFSGSRADGLLSGTAASSSSRIGGPGTRRANLPSVWQSALEDGRLNTALLLSTVYSEKYSGRTMVVGQKAPISLPTMPSDPTQDTAEPRFVHPTLLLRCGSLEASPFVWLGDEEEEDQTIYVVFGPLRRKRQFMKIVVSSFGLEPDPNTHGVKISGYIGYLLDKLWAEDQFGAHLSEIVRQHPNKRVLFAGLSHGAVLAQAAAFRFAYTGTPAQRSGPGISFTGIGGGGDVMVVTWNGYKWTDTEGARLASQHLQMLPFALSKVQGSHRYVDSVVEYPAGSFSALPGIIALDRDSGEFFDVRIGNAHRNLDFVDRMRQLHFAQGVIKAMKLAMLTSLTHLESSGIVTPEEIEMIRSRSLSLERRGSAEEADFMSLKGSSHLDSDEGEESTTGCTVETLVAVTPAPSP